MASTYSDLKIELIGTGDQTGTWGGTTNNNLSVAVSEAITGSADVPFSSSDVTVTLTDSNAAQTARNLRLNLTGTSGGARNLILGSGCQIEKLYIINNGLADAVTVKNTTGTGIAVPAGKTMFVFNNGTNVVDVTTYLSSLTLGTALPIASGGTGSTSTAYVNLASNVTGTLPVANGGTNASSASITAFNNITGYTASGATGTTSTNLVFSTSPTITTAIVTGVRETSVAISASAIDLAAGNYFTKTISGTTTFTISNAASSGTVNSFILQLTNGGSATVNYFSGVKWAGGTAPTLTASGVDVLGFYTLDGGTTYEGFVLGKAMA
jgi:hypothetical protein